MENLNIKQSDFNKRLAELREKKGLSQRDLAKITGISQRMLAHYEGTGDHLPIKNLIAIATALEVSLDQLFGFKPIKNVQTVQKKTALHKKIELIDTLPNFHKKTLLNMINMYIKANPLTKSKTKNA